MKGAFITVEGADGSGKTTHIDRIERWLQERGVQVVRTREPGGTPLGELLRGILLDDPGPGISRRCELLLVFAARAQHLDEVILPALAAGKWVLCDRFTDATYAYQGGGRGIEESAIAVLEQWVQGALQPDLTVLLDVSVETGTARARQRGGAPDRFEGEAPAFLQAVCQAYVARAIRCAGRIQLIDANRELDEVGAQIDAVLETFWRERRP